MDTKVFYLVNIGKLSFPTDFEKIFCSQGKYIVSKQVHKDYYFEMNGESMYYMLKSQEQAYNYDLHSYKERIVSSVCRRIMDCGGILLHKSLVSEQFDTQFRATNSAIRILLEALKDGYDVKCYLESLINYHYRHYLSLMDGIWFPHDLSEYNGECRNRQLKTHFFGKDATNTVTLNTHLDSLNTLLLIKSSYLSYDLSLDFNLEKYIDKAIKPLKMLYNHDKNSSYMLIILQKIDKWFYMRYRNINMIFKPILKFYDSLLHPILFKLLFPRMFFNYGFIARDLAIRHRHADYLLPNAVDLARFICLYKSQISCEKGLVDDLSDQLMKTITLINDTEDFISDYSLAWYLELIVLLDALHIPYIDKSVKAETVKYNPFIL